MSFVLEVSTNLFPISATSSSSLLELTASSSTFSLLKEEMVHHPREDDSGFVVNAGSDAPHKHDHAEQPEQRHFLAEDRREEDVSYVQQT